MSYHPPQSTPVPPPAAWIGVMWIIGTVAAWVVTPLLWLMIAEEMGWGRNCSATPGVPFELPPDCPREGLAAALFIMIFAMWVLFSGVVALVLGVLEGRHRRFAYRRRACAVLVTIATPWAMLAYAVGNGLGRLAPVPAGRPFAPPLHPRV
jgi:hypothetical protein